MNNSHKFSHAFTLSQDMSIAVKALLKAGDVIQKMYSSNNSLTLSKKNEVGDLVTQADIESNATICEFLRNHTPDYGLLSEEQIPNRVENTENLWIVDPLDATSAFYFQSGYEYPSVMIALQKHNTIRLGAVFFPMSGNLFYAEKHIGAFKNGKHLLIRPEKVYLENTWVAMNQYSLIDYETNNFKLLRDRLRTDNGAKLVTIEAPHSGISMYMLDGSKKISVIVHDNNLQKIKQAVWDVAPIQLIVEEAGGYYVNSKGERYDYSSPDLIIIASHKELVEELITLLNG